MAATGVLLGSAIHNGVDVMVARPIVLGLLWVVLPMGLRELEEDPAPTRVTPTTRRAP